MVEQLKKTAEEFAKEQKEISVSEFFEKNKHLLGFDNPTKALLMAVKEAVDNSLDAGEEAGILPDVIVKVKNINEDKYRVSVQDDGPGIVKEQVPRIFGKLLYGSKFHRLRQSLTYDEPIMVYKDGKIAIVPIGSFVDSILTDSEEKNISSLNIKVPAFDWNSYKYKFKRVSHVIRHKRENEILKIKLATNREIKVTGCHSLFSAENGEIKEIEARNLRVGDFIAIPKLIPPPEEIKEINILDYITLDDIKNNWFYVYGIEKEVFEKLLRKSSIVHKKTDKSRKYYRIGDIDILDDSWKQYTSKGFMPLHLVMKLNLKNNVKDCIIKSYHHGKETMLPVSIPLDTYFIRFLGIFVAEGYVDRQQIGLTFGKHEDKLIDESINFARNLGVNFTVEIRDASVRIKIFGGILSTLFEKLCGRGARNKHIPEFVFRVSQERRQHFLDGLYQCDGHKVKNRNCIMLSTVSKTLANEIMYLWLMQNVNASITYRNGKVLGKRPYFAYIVSIYGNDINKSYVFKTTKTRQLNYSSSNLFTQIKSDIILVPIKNIEIINDGYDFVYDISVPECENFVGGFGGISCHNSRGQQGIGISAVVLYSQLTTGNPTRVWSKTGEKSRIHYYELFLNTAKNEPEIVKEETLDKDGMFPEGHGVKVEMDVVGRYRKAQGVDDYLKQTSIANPFARIVYNAPDGTKTIFPRSVEKLPKPPKEMKLHPYGVEFGILQRILGRTNSKTLQSFLVNEFSSVGNQSAKEICKLAKLDSSLKPSSLTREQIDKLLNGMQKTKLQRPPLDCLSPIGAEALEKSLKKEYPNAEFVTAVTREPEVYRGNPFQIEVGIVYGLPDVNENNQIELIRLANRVPLLYQVGACATAEAVKDVDWKRYHLQQSGNNMPTGSAIIMIHMCSVWVPFVSESKEAIAPYPEIVKEMKLALQDAGRKLALYLSGKHRAGEAKRRIQIFERYSHEVANSLGILTKRNPNDIEKKIKDMIASRIHIKETEEEKWVNAENNKEVDAKIKKEVKPEKGAGMTKIKEKVTVEKSDKKEKTAIKEDAKERKK